VVPVHTTESQYDTLLLPYSVEVNCPRRDQISSQLPPNEANFKFGSVNDVTFYNFLKSKTGQPWSFSNVYDLLDILYCFKIHNFTLPSWVDATVYERLQQLNRASWLTYYEEPKLKSWRTGPLFNKLYSDLVYQRDCRLNVSCDAQFDSDARQAGRVATVYSGHSPTLASVLSGLNVNDLDTPPSAACIMIELHVIKTDSDAASLVKLNNVQFPYYFVRVLYSKHAIEKRVAQQLLIPGCSSKDCPLGEFLNILNATALTPDAFVNACKLQ